MSATANDLKESLATSIATLSNASVQASDAARTVEATIVSIEDEGLGLYKVNYKDNIFDAYSPSSVVYSQDDIVCILIPEGDSSKTKIILGAVSPSAEMEVNDLVEDYMEISDNFLNNIEDCELCTYRTEEHRSIGTSYIKQNLKNNLSTYLKNNQRDFLLTANIKTNIPYEQQVKGDYGIVLVIPLLQDPGTGDPIYNEDGTLNTDQQREGFFNLDTNNMRGNPYNLTEYSFQKLRVSIMNNCTFDNTRDPEIYVFVNNFSQSTDPNIPNDIFIKDISLKAIKVFNEEEKTGYNFSLVCNTGVYFLVNSSNTKTIQTKLYLNGKKTKVENNYDCYWFKKDASILPGSEGYNQLAGVGWRCLNERTNITVDEEEGRETFQYVTNVYTLDVKKDEVKSSLEFLCILVKKDNKTSSASTQNKTIISASIIMYNTTENITCSLVSDTGSNSYIKDTGDVTLAAKLYQPNKIIEKDSIEVSWLRYDADGNSVTTDIFIPTEEVIDGNNYELHIKFPVSYINYLNKIECTFSYTYINEYGILKKENLGSASLSIVADEEPTYKLYIQNGDVLYKYDANGNSPFTADYAYPTSMIKAINPLSYKIYKPDGTELSDKEYAYCKVTWEVSDDSLIKLKIGNSSTTIIEGVGKIEAPYSIADIQNPKKSEGNYIALTVNFNDITLTDVANIEFTKEGMLGVTGNKFTGIITHKYGNEYFGYGRKNSEGKVVKLQLCYCDNNHKQYYSDAPGDVVKIAGDQDNHIDYNFFSDFNVSIYDNSGQPIELKEGDTIIWSIFDSFNTNSKLDCDESEIKIKKARDNEGHITGFVGQDGIEDTSTILQAEISVGDTGAIQDKNGDNNFIEQNNKETIYAYYPIEIVHIGVPITIDEENGFYMPHISDGYEKVLYCTDGTNPQYDSSNPFKFVNTIDDLKLKSEDYSITQKATKNFNIPDDKIHNIECPIKPVTTFDNGIPLNSIKASFGYSAEYFQKANSKINNLITKRGELIEEQNNYTPEALEKVFSNIGTQEDSLEKEIVDLASTIEENLKLQEITSFLYNRKLTLDLLEKILTFSKQVNNYIVKELNIDTYYNNIALPSVNKRRKQLQFLNYVYEGLPADKFEEINVTISSDTDDYLVAFGLPRGTYLSVAQKSSLRQRVHTLNNYYKNYNYRLGKLINYNIFKTNILDKFTTTGQHIANFGNELVGFENLSVQYNAIICRLNNPFGTYTGTSDIDQQNFIEQNYPKIYPLISTANEIKNLLTEIRKIFDRNDLDEKYYTAYYQSEYEKLGNQIKDVDKEISEQNKVLRYKEKETIDITKPIIMVLNTYEFADLNGWDGSRLYIDETNQQYLYAPKVGAGIKEAVAGGTAFTGITMGVRSFTNDNSNTHHVGLFAYGKGVQTYFLNARDGSAIMGKSGTGQIIIDPKVDKGLIYSSTFQKKFKDDGKPDGYSQANENGEGMLIDLSTPEIRFGSGKFSVNSEGELTAKGGGSIAGQVIGNTQLHKNNLYLDSGTEHPKTLSEEAYTSYGIYSGGHDKLTRTNDGFYLSNDGLSIGNTIRITPGDSGKVLVGRVNGNNKQTISGDSSRAYIAFGGDTSQSEATDDGTGQAIAKVYIGTDGISLGKRFSVSSNGDLTAYSGTVGGQSLSKTELTSTNKKVKITSSGSIEGNYTENVNGQKIDSSGEAYFNNIHCKKVFEIGDSSVTGSNYQSSSGNAFNFGMGTYGSIANGGFSLIGNGTTYGATGGLNMSATTTKVSGSSYGDNLNLATYINKLVVDNVEIKNLLTYQNLDTAQQHKVVAKVNGTKTYTGSVSAGVVTITLPNVESTDLYYLGVDKDDNNSSSNP